MSPRPSSSSRISFSANRTIISLLSESFIIVIIFLIHRSQGVNQTSENILAANSQQRSSPAKLAPVANGIDGTNTEVVSQNGPRTGSVSNVLASANKIKPLIQAAFAATSNQAAQQLTESISDRPIIGQPIQANLMQQVAGSKPSPVPVNYFREDPLTYLNYASIGDEVLRKRTANFVYFNANFNNCRNCHKFFSTWKELAVDIRWWSQVIKMFAINCSDEDNIDTCRRAGVTQFPQVKYYWIMSNSLDQDGQRLRVLGKSVHAMRHMIMDKVLDNYAEHTKLLAKKAHLQASRTPTNLMAATSPMQSANPILSMIGPLMSMMGQSGGGLGAIMSSFAGKGGSSNLLGSLGGVQGISQLMNAFSSASAMRQQMSVQPLPRNWPELDVIDVADSQQLLDLLPLDSNRNIGALLIMETQEFLYTGPEVMLDLNPYSNQTYIARVRDDRSLLTKSLTKRDDILAPALIYVSELRQPKLITTAPKYTNDEDLRRLFVKAFEKRQVKYPLKRVWSVQINANQLARLGTSNSSDGQENEEILSKQNNVYMDDLTNALRASLMDQVFRHPDLSDDQYNALVKYVYALINYFPFHSDESIKFVKRLHTWLQNQVSPMDIGEYKKQFHDVDDALPKREWIACKSLSNYKSVPSKSRRPSFFDNPGQIGKVVSNITRLFRDHQQQASKLKNLFNVFTSNLSQNPQQASIQSSGGVSKSGSVASTTTTTTTTTTSTTKSPSKKKGSSSEGEGDSKREESPIERIIESLTSGSLGSDSSILKLISTALTGGGATDSSSSKSKFAREFPCGAWKLAHVMVVNEYVKDSPRKDVKHIVLHSLYHYMLQFYACSTCGNRVSDVSGEFRLHLDENLLDQSDSIMLLWKTHNRVNKRLESELRPGSPAKSQFPSETLCPKCRLPKSQSDLTMTPNWLEKQVLNFLVHHYRPQSLIISSNSSDSSGSSPTFGLDGRGLDLVTLICSLLISSMILHLRYWH